MRKQGITAIVAVVFAALLAMIVPPSTARARGGGTSITSVPFSGGTITQSLVIAPAASGTIPLNIRTNNSSGGSSDRLCTIGVAGSEYIGCYSIAATGGPRFQLTTVPLTITSTATDITTGTNEDLTISPNGTGVVEITKHVKSTTAQAIGAVAGSCTSPAASGTDLAGTASGTCTSGQTITITFGAAYGTAPRCIVSGSDANGGKDSPVASTSTTVLTITAANASAAGAANFAYICFQ